MGRLSEEGVADLLLLEGVREKGLPSGALGGLPCRLSIAGEGREVNELLVFLPLRERVVVGLVGWV